MLDDIAEVASVAAVAKPVPRSPDKAALQYLEASGARAISFTADVDSATISVGLKPDAVAVFWTAQAAKVRSVAAKARNIMGDAADTDAAISALREAAEGCLVTLTPHDVAVTRAANAAGKLDEFMSSMRGTGVLREFNRAFKLRREAAMADGRGFMSYKIALARLRTALVPLLMNGGKPAIGASLFATIFDT
jgi:hypothetical protein